MRWPAFLLALALVPLLSGCGLPAASSGEGLIGFEFPGCSTFKTQEGAQTAWMAAGKPKADDPDGDGVVCEKLVDSDGDGHDKSGGYVDDIATDPRVKRRIAQARKAKEAAERRARKALARLRPKPAPIPGSVDFPVGRQADCTLTREPVEVRLDADRYPQTTRHLQEAWRAGHPKVLYLFRPGADDNRTASLAGVRTKDTDGDGTVQDRDEYPMATSYEGGAGADIAHVAPADNRGAGSTVGARLRRYCDWQPYRIRAYSGTRALADDALVGRPARGYEIARAGDPAKTRARHASAERNHARLVR